MSNEQPDPFEGNYLFDPTQSTSNTPSTSDVVQQEREERLENHHRLNEQVLGRLNRRLLKTK